MRERLRSRRELVDQRSVPAHPQGHATVRILLPGCGYPMKDRIRRYLDIISEVHAKVEPFMPFFGRRSYITIEEHNVRDVIWIGDNLLDEGTFVRVRRNRFIGHSQSPFTVKGEGILASGVEGLA
ncbi:hypothetical protein CNY89_08960 [Amaricoccus sp. HAR-UPW-R2A-40]|nr:hypothetical protein CNY89_08960 [Amaricoccus sp. HAR-UPW-R2A-40]